MIHLTASGVYPWLRLLLAITCAVTAWRLKSWYFAISAIALAIPASLYDPRWWRTVWLPVESIRLICAAIFTVNLIRRSSRKVIHDHERDFVFALGTSVGIILACAGFLWIPENRFQAAITARQYAYLILAALAACWLIWTRCIRPVIIPLQYGWITLAWCVWLWLTVVMAAAGKGGLVWLVVPWSGNAMAWYLIGDIGMVGQLLIAAALLTFHACEATA